MTDEQRKRIIEEFDEHIHSLDVVELSSAHQMKKVVQELWFVKFDQLLSEKIARIERRKISYTRLGNKTIIRNYNNALQQAIEILKTCSHKNTTVKNYSWDDEGPCHNGWKRVCEDCNTVIEDFTHGRCSGTCS